MKRILVLLLLCISIGVYADKREDCYDAAKNEMSVGKYGQALKHLEKLVNVNGGSANYRDVEQMMSVCKGKLAAMDKIYNEAKALMKKKQYDQALSKLQDVKKRDRDDDKIYKDVGDLIKQCETKIHEEQLAAAQRKKQQETQKPTTEVAVAEPVVEPTPTPSAPKQIGYAALYNDYFDTHAGDWRLQWFTIDFHGATTVGDNISIMNFRWKPVEASLLNLNLDYIHDGGFSLNWEPIVRGYLPVTHDGRWSVYTGMGAHVSLYGGSHHFLFEIGAEANWNEKYSSRMFFKYNGGVAIGMSFSIGKWL